MTLAHKRLHLLRYVIQERLRWRSGPVIDGHCLLNLNGEAELCAKARAAGTRDPGFSPPPCPVSVCMSIVPSCGRLTVLRGAR